jgi:hypothetical protein
MVSPSAASVKVPISYLPTLIYFFTFCMFSCLKIGVQLRLPDLVLDLKEGAKK